MYCQKEVSMFELLLGLGNSGKIFFPDSGPGTKYLKAGNADIGWFGLVSSMELFQGWEVSSALNFTAGTAVNENNTTWMKFVYKGKYLFIAQQPLRQGVSWNDVYNAGGIYGVKGNGAYPVAGNPRDQWNIMVKPEAGVPIPWKLSVRCLSGAPEAFDASVVHNAINTAPDNEFNDLIFRIVQTGPAVPWKGVFEQYPTASLQPGLTATVLKETQAANTTLALSRRTDGYSQILSKSSFADRYWRPVLELQDGQLNVFNPYKLYPEFLGNQGPASITGQFVDVVSTPSQPLFDDGGAAKVMSITNASFIDVVWLPSNPVVSNTIVPVSMTFTRT